MRANRNSTVYGFIRPRHVVGSYPVRIYKYRLVSGKWKSYGWQYAVARAYNSLSTKYAASVKLPYRGTWRLKAFAPTDTWHYQVWSPGYDTVNVK